MKKGEKTEYINKRSKELAQSGEYSSWLSIEHAIRAEGFPEARHVLDDRYTREELDKLCQMATSAEEKERRTSFEKWLSELHSYCRENNEVLPDIKIYPTQNGLSLNYQDIEIGISRSFNSSNLKISVSIEMSDRNRYRVDYKDDSLELDFKMINKDNMGEFIKKLVGRCKSFADAFYR